MNRLFHSIKVRIALIIVLVQAGLLFGVLGLTLPHSLDAGREQVLSHEQAVVSLLAEIARVALLTEEFSEFDIHIQHLLEDPNVLMVVLADDRNRVVASDNESYLGQQIPELSETTICHWQKKLISNQAGPLGTLAIRFSDNDLKAIFNSVWYRGLVLGLGGLLVASFVAIGLGHVLSRRLEMLTKAARKMASGDLEVASGVTGKDEVGLLGRAFDQMVHNINHEFQKRQKVEKELEHNAFHDPLTGLPNRHSVLIQLQHMIEHARRKPDYRFAVMFLDLDDFKKINDSFGHAAGDDVLIEVSQRLRELFRATDSISRLGGDEFLLVMDEIADPMAAIHIAGRIKETLSHKYHVKGYDCYISCSIGITFSDPRYVEAEEMIRDADTAMYRAKQTGHQGYAVFDQSMHQQVLENLQLENELRSALKTDQLLVYYQPIYSLEEQQVCSLEALVRWQHPTRGLLNPDTFIPIAEDSGLINELGQWVLEQACRQVQRLGSDSPCSISVNISPRQLFSSDLIQQVAKVLEESRIRPEHLCLELTESLLIENIDSALETMHELKKLGVKISIDDFGTGYSSLSYLQLLPFDVIKIDKSFIQSLTSDEKQKSIVPIIIMLAKSLGLQVVAEGVETEQQLYRLAKLKCTHIQGFLLGQPAPYEKDKGFEKLQSEAVFAQATALFSESGSSPD